MCVCICVYIKTYIYFKYFKSIYYVSVKSVVCFHCYLACSFWIFSFVIPLYISDIGLQVSHFSSFIQLLHTSFIIVSCMSEFPLCSQSLMCSSDRALFCVVDTRVPLAFRYKHTVAIVPSTLYIACTCLHLLKQLCV